MTGEYRLSPRALADLDEIWRYTAETWSIEQADRYVDGLVHTLEMIATMPSLSRRLDEFDPPVRVHTYQRHLIVYTADSHPVVVIRLLGGRQDWLSILRAAEL